ncbi:magnesium-translocating P-type ATPase [Limnoglobus roseus]|uniref:Magnesium-transporting ATPase, P-type 1 n=1 Tax=Limnoglobus roseus TaxID=2598579 RepID=A0A5C1AR92_9BACT|nr:magnesium-translocating P-type ATPase [Limnoglobus roseus]QEL20496.1 magnesium-translocating P-type ATPase [Limnoglobus roseus]
MASVTSPSPEGLTTAEARSRLDEHGPNEITPTAGPGGVKQLLITFLNPLTVILLVAGGVAAGVGDYATAAVIGVVVGVSSLIQFFHTLRSDQALRHLQDRVAVTATVRRDGVWAERPRRDVVPGDLIRLAAGDFIPADARLVTARDLHVLQAALTGESLPVEKEVRENSGKPGDPLALDRPDAVFFGTSVVSGTGTAVVAATGRATAFGDVAARLAAKAPETEFDRGTRRFGLFITQTVFALVVFVFVVAVARQLPAMESLLFALALAVGLTPGLLPMIVNVTLARGAVRMARQDVIVKHLAAIQNLGSMDVLCTDKTGTLTRGDVSLVRCDTAAGVSADRVLLLAYLNSRHETGFKNPLDVAILAHPVPAGVEGFEKLDEVPFDFERRRLSVVLRGPSGVTLVTKGAPESVLDCCGSWEDGPETRPLDAATRDRVLAYVRRQSVEGYRLLAVASRVVTPGGRYSAADEVELTLAGFLAFTDPIREDAADAIRDLAADGVRVVMISGDDEHVARRIADLVGLGGGRVVSGGELAGMTDPALGAVAEQVAVFARTSPAQKNRILLALKARGHVVGFLGDGVNDAPSIHAADVGISVSTAVDVAKAAAEVILMKPGLRVIHDGVLEGRRAFTNVMKYLLMGTSSNFGNMLSMAAAVVFLPFLPMLPLQILLNNLLYDLAQLPIPTDRVDAALVRKPRKWDVSAIRTFMLVVGPVSSAFDLVTFAGLVWLFHATATAFQTGWFVESLFTQTLVVLVIRTAGNPFRSRPSPWVLGTVIGVCGVAVALPFTPVAGPLGFEPLPGAFVPFLLAVAAAYLLAVEVVKRRFFRDVAARA